MVSAYSEHDGKYSAEEELADSKASGCRAGSSEPFVEATLFDKFAASDDPAGNLLSKRIALGPEGRPVSDGSPCRMSRGRAHRLRLPLHRALPVFARLIDDAPGNRAFSLGALAAHLPDQVGIVVEGSPLLNETAPVPIIARREKNWTLAQGPGLALIDIDWKGCPPELKARIEALGGAWAVIVSVAPELAGVSHLIRNSTSAGLRNRATGVAFPGSGGLHLYLLLKQQSDLERFLKTLHARLCLAGFGWPLLTEGGAVLLRSPLDTTVGQASRLIFEGRPTWWRRSSGTLRRPWQQADLSRPAPPSTSRGWPRLPENEQRRPSAA